MDTRPVIVSAPGAYAINTADLIARIESSGNPRALRFEPGVFANLSSGNLTPAHARIVSTIQDAHHCNVATAKVIYSTSYGLFQLMGFNLYDESDSPIQTDVFGYCSDPLAQVAKFDAFVTKRGIAYTSAELASDPTKRGTFARIYNGDPVAYGAAIVSACEFFNLQVTK
jgi:hypothetical protein